jgi:Flp pilus assembly protein TadG
MAMIARRSSISSQRGYALIYMSVVLAVLLIFTGLAVDTGRAYVVKAQLTKAVDGAALAAARNLNSGNPRGEAVTIFKANFPAGYLGTSSSTDPTSDPGFFQSTVNATTGVNTVTVTASAVLPTTFMRLANFNQVSVRSMGEATRRMVDLSLVLDGSSSIGYRWPAVRDAARTFVDAFDATNDRLSLIIYGNGARVIDAMPSSRGFNKTQLKADIPTSLPNGSTAMVEGLYRGWDELRSVQSGQQSGLRVIVLFTDGASNSVPGIYETVAPGVSRGLRTYDFPKNLPDPDGQTWDDPRIEGVYDTNTGTQSTPPYGITVPYWKNNCSVALSCLTAIPYLPLTSYHANHRSAGIRTSFPLQDGSLKVNGSAQSSVSGLRNQNLTTGRYPAEVFNINNAARNLLEIIANAARTDTGDYPIRIYTIGMGELVRYNLGTMPEKPEDILKRIANDQTSLDFVSAQLDGKYYYAKTEADVGPAFQALQNQIIRLSK